VDQESPAHIQQIVSAATEALRSEIVDAKHHAGVLTEGLRHELQLVAGVSGASRPTPYRRSCVSGRAIQKTPRAHPSFLRPNARAGTGEKVLRCDTFLNQ